ncbi:hypothetical protein [Streptomyces sp. Ru87]|uniref:hypothetical protein n=1 Tax=Streptomyces sp. Ru87 TaxID=2044307 RepID=UPI000BF476ED|nr:hypothetical protein [Streptomyces sp. Ru87]PGH51599.1 hypothetical protein CRI70_05685 [Streptomyces sp. Ru87]
MDTEAQRTAEVPARERPGAAAAEHRAEAAEEGPEHLIPADGSFDAVPPPGRRNGRSLWTVEPAVRAPLPDPVRTAAVRAVIIVAVTLIMAMVAFLCTLAQVWFAFPAVLGTVGGTVVATWSVLDVWITRQVWNQRNGVVSVPSSTARALRRERRRARRAARAAARARPRGRAGRLSSV